MSDLPPPDPSQRNLYTPEPSPAGETAGPDRLRRILVAVGGVAMVVFAIGLGLIVLRDDDPGSGDSGEDAAVPTTPAADAPPSAPATPGSTTDASQPAGDAGSGAGAGTATTTVAASPGAATTTTTGAAGTPAPTDPAARAVATAQALLDAFADGRWNDARTLNPGRNETDAFLQLEYGPIETATLIPAVVTAVSDGQYDVRFGIVAHENQPTGRQTVLMCSHWQVDVDRQTVQRLDSARIRVEGGYVDPQARAGELSSVCASLPLR